MKNYDEDDGAWWWFLLPLLLLLIWWIWWRFIRRKTTATVTPTLTASAPTVSYSSSPSTVPTVTGAFNEGFSDAFDI